MNTGIKIALGVIGVVGIGTGLYFIFKDKKDKPTDPDNNNKEEKTNNNVSESSSSSYKAETDPLSKYDRGDNVKCLQALLNFFKAQDVTTNITWGKDLDVDGYYGPKTEAMVNKVVSSATFNTINSTTVSYGALQASLELARMMVAQPALFPGVATQEQLDKVNAVCNSASCCLAQTASFAGRSRTKKTGNFAGNSQKMWF